MESLDESIYQSCLPGCSTYHQIRAALINMKGWIGWMHQDICILSDSHLPAEAKALQGRILMADINNALDCIKTIWAADNA